MWQGFKSRYGWIYCLFWHSTPSTVWCLHINITLICHVRWHSELKPWKDMIQHATKPIICPLFYIPSLVVQTVKNLPTVLETWVQSLGQKDPLEKDMATHSSILVWRIPWTEEPGGQWGCKELDTTKQLTLSFTISLTPPHVNPWALKY